MQASASFCTKGYRSAVTAWPGARLPGCSTTLSPGLSPATISILSPSRRPVCTRTSTIFPWRTTSTFSTPAKVTSEAAGMRITGCEPSVTMSARVKAPGFSTALGLGTSASTRSVRFCSCTIGLSRTTRPWWTVAAPSRLRRTIWPTRTPAASRSGTGRRSPSGCVRTSVATGARAARGSLAGHGTRRPDDGGLLRIDLLVGAGQRQPQPRARLLQRRGGLLDAQLVVRLIDPRDDLVLAHARAEVHRLLDETAGNLDAEHHGVVGGQRSGGRDRARHALLDSREDLDGTRRDDGGWLFRRRGGGSGRGRLAGAAGGSQHDGEQRQPGAGHPADDTPERRHPRLPDPLAFRAAGLLIDNCNGANGRAVGAFDAKRQGQEPAAVGARA